MDALHQLHSLSDIDEMKSIEINELDKDKLSVLPAQDIHVIRIKYFSCLLGIATLMYFVGICVSINTVGKEHVSMALKLVMDLIVTTGIVSVSIYSIFVHSIENIEIIAMSNLVVLYLTVSNAMLFTGFKLGYSEASAIILSFIETVFISMIVSYLRNETENQKNNKDDGL